MGRPLPWLKNPADSLIKIASTNFPKTEKDQEKLEQLFNHYGKVL
jgi:hypothetical protein